MNIIITMCKLFFAMAIGYYLNKKSILTKEINSSISSMILEVTMPLLILSSSASMESNDRSTVLFLFVTGVIFYALMPFLSFIIVKLLRCPKECEGVYRCMLIFSNTAFMGYPVVEALYGNKAVLYASILHMGFNVMFFAYGTYLIAKDAGEVMRFEWKRLLNTGVLSGVMVFVLCLSNTRLPEILVQPFQFVGNITMPLSMIVIGANMGEYSMKVLLDEKKLYYITVLRLFVLPLLAAFCISAFTDNKMVIGVAAMTIGMPVAASVAMGSAKYEKQGKTGSISVALTTLCSMISLPILALIIDFVFGK